MALGSHDVCSINQRQSTGWGVKGPLEMGVIHVFQVITGEDLSEEVAVLAVFFLLGP